MECWLDTMARKAFLQGAAVVAPRVVQAAVAAGEGGARAPPKLMGAGAVVPRVEQAAVAA
jgi:hypothetical protein